MTAADEAAASAAMAGITVLLLDRGCPVALLDEAWAVLADQTIASTPGRMIAQIDAAIARARD